MPNMEYFSMEKSKYQFRISPAINTILLSPHSDSHISIFGNFNFSQSMTGLNSSCKLYKLFSKSMLFDTFSQFSYFVFKSNSFSQ